MDLVFQKICSSRSYDDFDKLGVSPQLVHQVVTSAYAPRVSTLSTKKADQMASRFGKVDNIYTLFGYFENVFSFGENFDKQISSSVANNKEQSLNGSGCVRFVGDVLNFSTKQVDPDELFNLDFFQKELKDYKEMTVNSIRLIDDAELNYDTYRRNHIQIERLENSIYLKMISLVNMSESPSMFECFNHPVMQLVVISADDLKEDIDGMVSTLEKRKYPKWIDIDSIHQHILIIFDQSDASNLQNALKIQEELKFEKKKQSTVVPLNFTDSKSPVLKLYPSVFSVKENDELEDGSIFISQELFESLRLPLQSIVSRELVLFMNNKIKLWHEEVVTPRTSITGRLFGGRKWGGSSKTNFFSFGSSSTSLAGGQKEDTILGSGYNSSAGYYMYNSPEMILRKLGDWYFMLGDYKNAYSTYELIKKDMTNDNAFPYLASLQEHSVLSLLIGAIQKAGSGSQQLTLKMISTVINPLVESSFYSYLSRCNLKTYAIRMIILVSEFYFLLGQQTAMTTKPGSPISPSEIFLTESVRLFKKLIDAKLMGDLANGFLIQRVAVVYSSYELLFSFDPNFLFAPDEPYYESENDLKKVVTNPNKNCFGVTRNRKMILWLLLATRAFIELGEHVEAELTLWKVATELSRDTSKGRRNEWLERRDGLFFELNTKLENK